MSEKSSVREEIALIAGPRQWGETRERWFSRVHKQVPTVSYRTIRALWYGEIQADDHWAARDIRNAADEVRKGQARQTARKLADQFEQIAGGLSVTDQDFHSDTIAALVSAARALRNVDSA